MCPFIRKSTDDDNHAAPAGDARATPQASDAPGNAPDDSSGLRRLHLVFAGEVQGVGFRWTSQRSATNTGCTGWVRNERDGTVTLELQGTDDQIADYFGAFTRFYSRYPIKYVIEDKRELDPDPSERGFSVRY
jgi:acylphosphatase